MSAITRAVDAIELILRAQGPVRLIDLAHELGLAKSSAHRLVTTLEEADLLARTEGGNLTIGVRLVGWAAATDATSHLRTIAEPLMRQLRDTTGETVNLHVRRGADRICLVTLPGTFSLVPALRVGEPIPLGRGATGRLLLAHAPADIIHEVSRKLPDLGITPPTDEDLDRWRRDLWLVIKDDLEPGLAAAATVVALPHGEPAALSIGGSSLRLDEARFRDLRPLLMRCAGLRRAGSGGRITRAGSGAGTHGPRGDRDAARGRSPAQPGSRV
ncbi:MAG TPA: IclR family transcriptional regulator, partial [Propionibacterium sp.]|nr:IclR family transcriptional regulator [Propionibacterium sp.]